MRIQSVEAFAIRLPRGDAGQTTGTAGSPIALKTGERIQWAGSYRTVYSAFFETALVRVETSDGVIGWGESQAPVAPEVVKTIVDCILRSVLVGTDALDTEAAWESMYASMRARGQTGGFMLDAISGVDIALWDIRGKVEKKPIFDLIGNNRRFSIPIYISGLSGGTAEERVDFVRAWISKGAKAFKIFMDAGTLDCLATLQAIRAGCGDAFELYVDALWRLDVPRAAEFSYALRELKVGFLEAPLPPESVEEHRQLATKSAVPIAIGESYRTRYEIGPFLEAGACQVLQPDIGRCGITEGLRIAKLAGSHGVPVIPHLSIGLGPQVAAALHLSAATPGIRMLECNPKVYSEANRFLRSALTFDAAAADVPIGHGLGIALDEKVLTESIR